MSDEVPPEPDESPSRPSTWHLVRPFALLGTLAAALSFLALRRPLTAPEAGFLMNHGDLVDFVSLVQRGWTVWAGIMEQPARALAVLSTIAGSGVILGTTWKSDGHRAPVIALLVLAASPTWWSHGIAIGASAVIFLLAALVLAFLVFVVRLKCDTAGRIGFLVAAVLPLVLTYDPANPLRQLSEAAHPGIMRFSVLPLFILLLWREIPGWAGDLVCALTVPACWTIVALTNEAPNLYMAAGAILPPAAVLLGRAGGRHEPTRKARPIMAILAVIAVAIFAALHFDHGKTAEGARHRAVLEWLTYNVDQKGWVLFVGKDADLYLYFERGGHRTGQETLATTSLTNAREIADRALDLGITEIALVGEDLPIRDALAKRFDVVESFSVDDGDGDIPEDVTIFRNPR